MNGELISVIIPVYKTEPYLEKCVQSVLGQTYGDLEVILVDDGSPDGCPALCDGFARRDGRVRVIHKANGGQGSARNRGLDAATGAYIGFVDSDDYILPEMYEKLAAALAETGADAAVCDHLYVETDGRVSERLPVMETACLTREQVFDALLTMPGWWRLVSPVVRLCRREVFEGLRFPEDKKYEDLFLTRHLYARCRAVALIPDSLYMYVQSPDSSMRAAAAPRDLDQVEGYLDLYRFYRRRGRRDQAGRALRIGSIHLWNAMRELDVWEHRRAVWPVVRRMLAAQARQRPLSALRLGAAYALRTVRCALGRG